ncbi:MAG TPA: DUF4124 domain-containing protein [Desulfuromonadales bacterium]|nr:DUF4124 domain-containing protein [Desulfuromonadales bacterium]
MRHIIVLITLLLIPMLAGAETYSWVDEAGSYNFTDDYSKIPKKFRNKVNRHGDATPDPSPPPAPAVQKTSLPDKQPASVATTPQDDKQLYAGKSYSAWRTEKEKKEDELKVIDQQLVQIQNQLAQTKGISREQIESLKLQYRDTRNRYDHEYKSYTELVETIRKAGLTVEMPK